MKYGIAMACFSLRSDAIFWFLILCSFLVVFFLVFNWVVGFFSTSQRFEELNTFDEGFSSKVVVGDWHNIDHHILFSLCWFTVKPDFSIMSRCLALNDFSLW